MAGTIILQIYKSENKIMGRAVCFVIQICRCIVLCCIVL